MNQIRYMDKYADYKSAYLPFVLWRNEAGEEDGFCLAYWRRLLHSRGKILSAAFPFAADVIFGR